MLKLRTLSHIFGTISNFFKKAIEALHSFIGLANGMIKTLDFVKSKEYTKEKS